jgi:hypothetical protein
MISYRWCASLVILCLVSGACRAQGQSTPTSTAPSSTPDTSTWFQSNTAAKTVTLSLAVTRTTGAASASINGFRSGQSQVIVPFGWTVTWNWRNLDSTSPHSLVAMIQREKIPLEGGRPAFSNAMTRMVTEGLPAGQTDRTTFEADEAGWFWLLCGVPGHAVAGEWIELQVSREAKTAAVKQKSR